MGSSIAGALLPSRGRMPIDRESLEADLANLKEVREQLIANVNATVGAIQYIEKKLQEPAGHESATEIKD
jgi:hypothetical protein